MLLSAMCVTTYLKAMLTDEILLSVSSRAANYAPHKTIMLHGGLSATSPAHHRMAINHLLQRFCIMPFLGLVATQRGKYDYYSKSCGRSYLPWSNYLLVVKSLFAPSGFPCTCFSKCGQVSHELMKASITLLALYIEMD